MKHLIAKAWHCWKRLSEVNFSLNLPLTKVAEASGLEMVLGFLFAGC
ncbi:MAG: hypothetical protein KBD04_00115 [Proteobacteria bacterium]|nr:hypothetical protein [Pseudomonadota bacterium]